MPAKGFLDLMGAFTPLTQKGGTSKTRRKHTLNLAAVAAGGMLAGAAAAPAAGSAAGTGAAAGAGSSTMVNASAGSAVGAGGAVHPQFAGASMAGGGAGSAVGAGGVVHPQFAGAPMTGGGAGSAVGSGGVTHPQFTGGAVHPSMGGSGTSSQAAFTQSTNTIGTQNMASNSSGGMFSNLSPAQAKLASAGIQVGAQSLGAILGARAERKAQKRKLAHDAKIRESQIELERGDKQARALEQITAGLRAAMVGK